MLTTRNWFILAAGLLVAPSWAVAQIPAFPGAEGFGASSVGGRGGDVYHVISLADTNTLGTLRHAISSAPGSGRIVVFDISGNIDLNSDLSVNNPKITIAGQTAPGQGITLSGDSVWLEDNDLVVRYIRSRLTSDGGTQDSLSIRSGNRVMLDHSSASWSSDEVTSMTQNSTDNTIQWSLITEALNVANHSRASLFRPGEDPGAPFSYNLSVHHSLYAHSSDRNPVFSTYNDKVLNADFRNNVVFDWRNQATHTGDVDSNVNLNFVGNYYVAGLTTRPDLVADPSIFSAGSSDTVLYRYDNKVDATRDDGLHNGVELAGSYGGPYVEVFSPFNYPTVVTQSSDDAYDSVLDYAGSFWWNRDPVDQRVITDVHEISDPNPTVRASSGMMITTEADVGGLPVLPSQTRDADWDFDGDGMPRYWEIQHGLDPNTGGSAQYNGDFDGDGYTNVEEYINEAGAFPAPQEIVWDGSTDNKYAKIQNWDITWQPSRYDDVAINNGTVAVDDPGQHAKNLRLGTGPGNNVQLNISGDGWLKVEDALQIGVDGSATAAVSLSSGILSVGELSLGAGDSFSFTGGTLHADQVNFDPHNYGGTIGPGQGIPTFSPIGPTPNSSVGQMHVADDLTIHSGTLAIELASATVFDTLLVDGDLTLGGDLEVDLLNGYTPTSGTWEIANADNIAGGFGSVTPGFSVEVIGDTLYLLSGGLSGLAGDYNNDFRVDAVDYTVWRDAMTASSIAILNDPTPGTVDETDFLAWRDHYGETAGAGGGQGAAGAVPEPASLGLLGFGLAGGLCVGRRPSRVRRGKGLQDPSYSKGPGAIVGSRAAAKKRPFFALYGPLPCSETPPPPRKGAEWGRFLQVLGRASSDWFCGKSEIYCKNFCLALLPTVANMRVVRRS